jgi:tetratricopeptide (TPR) repeat protein
MSKAGFVYVLTNPSMEGFVKIGKTSKSPEGRAKELSASTGVPTPFAVAFDVYFDDCDLAEARVHTLLEEKGYRVSTNREFFQIPLSASIKILLAVKDDLGGRDEHDSGEVTGHADARDVLSPSAAILEEADAYYNGYGKSLQDFEEAHRLYGQAARLGSAGACAKLAEMYLDGKGCEQDSKLAIRYFKEGMKRGNRECRLRLAMIFSGQVATVPVGAYVNVENARKTWRAVIDKLWGAEVVKQASPSELDSAYASTVLAGYLHFVTSHGFFEEGRQILAEQGEDILKWASPEILYMVGTEFGKAGDFTQSQRFLEYAVMASPEYADAHSNLGIAFVKQDKHNEAIDCFKRAIEISPDEIKYRRNLASTQQRGGMFEDAITSWREVLRLCPFDEIAFLHIGSAFHDLKQFAEAESALRRAIKIKYDFGLAYYCLGMVLSDAGQLSKGREAFEKAVACNPDNHEFLDAVGSACLELNDHKAAFIPLKKAAILKKDYAPAHFHLGEAYLATGDRESANKELQILVTMDVALAAKLENELKK